MLDGFRPGPGGSLKGHWTYVLLPFDEWLMEPDFLNSLPDETP